MTPQPQITVCVPVYNGEAFLTPALESVARQTCRPTEVLISDDASTDGSAAAAGAIAQQHGFELIEQPHRLGWIANCNVLLERARGDYVCIVAHDDMLDPRYVEALAAHLRATPVCVQAFCDIEGFGLTGRTLTQPSLVGSPFERQRRLLESHFDGTAFRGLIRRDALMQSGGLPDNAFDGFAADIGWLGRLARAGEVHRVPVVLYFKRFHAGSASMAWSRFDPDARIAAWTDHCADLLRNALALELSDAERSLILQAAARRLLMVNAEPGPFPEIRRLPDARKAEMVSAMLKESGTGPWSGEPSSLP